VSEVDVSGQVLSTFADVLSPRHLSLDSEDRLLVTDAWNHRILLLSSGGLQLQRVLIDTNSQVSLWWPTRLCYNERTSQLFVAHCSVNRCSYPDVISVFSLH